MASGNSLDVAGLPPRGFHPRARTHRATRPARRLDPAVGRSAHGCGAGWAHPSPRWVYRHSGNARRGPAFRGAVRSEADSSRFGRAGDPHEASGRTSSASKRGRRCDRIFRRGGQPGLSEGTRSVPSRASESSRSSASGRGAVGSTSLRNQQSQYHMHLRRNLPDHLHFLRTRNCCAQGRWKRLDHPSWV